jgi:hypothetical protein
MNELSRVRSTLSLAVIAGLAWCMGTQPVFAQNSRGNLDMTQHGESEPANDHGLQAELSRVVGPEVTGALLFADVLPSDAPATWLTLWLTVEREGQLVSPRVELDGLNAIVLKLLEDEARNDSSVRFLVAFLQSGRLSLSFGYDRDLSDGEDPFWKYEAATEQYFGRPWVTPSTPSERDNTVIQRGVLDQDVLEDMEDE